MCVHVCSMQVATPGAVVWLLSLRCKQLHTRCDTPCEFVHGCGICPPTALLGAGCTIRNFTMCDLLSHTSSRTCCRVYGRMKDGTRLEVWTCNTEVPAEPLGRTGVPKSRKQTTGCISKTPSVPLESTAAERLDPCHQSTLTVYCSAT